jgi:hypothetical protein
VVKTTWPAAEKVYAGSIVGWKQNLITLLNLALEPRISDSIRMTRVDTLGHWIALPLSWDVPLIFAPVHRHVLGACADYQALVDILVEYPSENWWPEETMRAYLDLANDEWIQVEAELAKVGTP